MKFLSGFSASLDPYRAGVELGTHLKAIQPEVIFLFSSIHYDGSPELLEALYDTIDVKGLVIIGNTGDGCFEKERVASVGVSALGIDSGGQVRWHLAVEPAVGADPKGATDRCLSSLGKCCTKEPAFHFIASDFQTDASAIIDALKERVQGPVVGGLAGDDFSFQRNFVFANREVVTDSIAILAAEGDLTADILLVNTLKEKGQVGTITSCADTVVETINDIPAMEFVEQQVGQPLARIDQGILAFKVVNSDHAGLHRIRSLILPEGDEGSVKLFGSIRQGESVQLCTVSCESILSDLKGVKKQMDALSSSPLAAIMVSCAGRKSHLLEALQKEPETVLESCSTIKALVGYPSFGEIGSIQTERGYTEPLFHNMSLVILLLGAPQ